jgi:hypothetical protein
MVASRPPARWPPSASRRATVREEESMRYKRILVLAVLLIAQALVPQATPDHARSHHHYQLIDLGTFGGPNSSLPDSIESLDPSGAVTGCADTSFLDPDFAIQNSYFSDPYIERSYIWNDGHRTALPALRSARNACPQGINESASIVGASENGQIDPLTGLKEVHAVL